MLRLRGSPSQGAAVISNRSELPADLGADAEVVFEVAFEDVSEVVVGREDLIGSIGAEQPRPGDRDLIAYTEAKLRVLGADAVILEGLHRGHLEDELLIQIEEILQANRAAEGVGASVVEFREAGQGVGLEVDANILQYARAIAIDQGLRVAEADEEVRVGDQRARQARDQAVLRNDGNAVTFPFGVE